MRQKSYRRRQRRNGVARRSSRMVCFFPATGQPPSLRNGQCKEGWWENEPERRYACSRRSRAVGKGEDKMLVPVSSLFTKLLEMGHEDEGFLYKETVKSIVKFSFFLSCFNRNGRCKRLVDSKINCHDTRIPLIPAGRLCEVNASFKAQSMHFNFYGDEARSAQTRQKQGKFD